MHWSPDHVVWFQALAWVITLGKTLSALISPCMNGPGKFIAGGNPLVGCILCWGVVEILSNCLITETTWAEIQ